MRRIPVALPALAFAMLAGCATQTQSTFTAPAERAPGLPAAHPAPIDAALPDVFAYVPHFNGFTNSHPAGEGDLQLRSATTGLVLRTLLSASPQATPTSISIGSSGKYAYYTLGDPHAPGLVRTPYRIPIGGGVPERLPLPTYGGQLQAEVTDLVAAPDDKRFAYVIDATPDHSAELVATEVGGETVALPGGDPIGWTDDDHLLIRDPGPGPDLTVRSVDVTQPATETTVLSISGEDPANPGPCTGPIDLAGSAAMPDDTLVITRSRCSAGLITTIDLRTGTRSSVRLSNRYAAVYPMSVVLAPSGTVVLPLGDRNAQQPDPIVAVHGTTITRIGVGTGY